MLHYLAYKHDGVYSGVLKDQLGVGSGRMADILRRLEEKELIVRSEDTEDSRSFLYFCMIHQAALATSPA